MESGATHSFLFVLGFFFPKIKGKGIADLMDEQQRVHISGC